ncbi:hypothetical protein OE09_0034 [Flavobacteriaceae bacterium MAR_2010_72]|nr:hypothetical protein OE09_0034 [Flavobacteriaceae bacterium MAR_2010_72]TVZ58262.1 hypothetical protein NA63_0758 [Flavobacteriaceae bacterium MAR_2010_105]
MKTKAINVIVIFFLLDLIFLITMGKSYTKLILIPPFFYAHDVLLFAITSMSAWFINKAHRIKSVEIVFILATIYLIISFFRIDFDFKQSYFPLRQFMIYGYGLSTYIIINSLYENEFIKRNFTKFIGYLGLLCIAVQVIYVVYLFKSSESDFFFERKYLSPMVIMGFFVGASYMLNYIKKNYLKHIVFVILFILSLTTGHDSAYLALALIYFSYFFLQFNSNYRLILVIGLIALIIGVFVFVPSFTDLNVMWRLTFWEDSLYRLVNNYFIFGEGFGIQYANDETITRLNDLFYGVNGPQIIGDDKFVTAPHNSFITMILHIGVLSIILLIYPLKTLFSNKRLQMNNEILFLFLSLLGIAIFCSFNVILELPHSSSLFWIVYFGLVFKLNDNKYQNEL